MLIAAYATASSIVCVAATFALFIRERGLRRRAEADRALLREIVEALPGGFVAWDADDRLVTHDEEFLRVYSRSVHAIRPGARFEDIIRAGVAAGQYTDVGDDTEAFVRRTTADHQRGTQKFERRMPDGRWFLISEKRMARGGIVGVRSDITDIKRAEAALAAATAKAEHLARHDPLTGLPNRAAFDAALAVAGLGEGPVALLYLDLDGFKAINDGLGHAAGDAILREAAARLREAAAGSEVARLGGDEFAIVMPSDTTALEAEALADRLVQALRRPYRTQGTRLPDVGASVGLAYERGLAAEDLAQIADEALYAAKQAGRRTWRRGTTPIGRAA